MSRKVLIALTMTAVMGASAAMADDGLHQHGIFDQSYVHQFDHSDRDCDHRCDSDKSWNDGPASAPEIDPASAIGALTLLAGGLAVVRGRRGRR